MMEQDRIAGSSRPVQISSRARSQALDGRPAGAGALFALLTVVLAVSVLVPPTRETPISLCLVHLLFGIPGPGCGMTRAFLFLGHGDLHAALELNPASPLAFALVLGLWANAGLIIFTGRELRPVSSRRGRWAVGLAAALLALVVWIYNLVWNPWV